MPGYTFTASAVDAGRRRHGDRAATDRRSSARDRLAVTVRDPLGAVVWGADWPVRSGDIAITVRDSGDEVEETHAGRDGAAASLGDVFAFVPYPGGVTVPQGRGPAAGSPADGRPAALVRGRPIAS